MTTILQECVTRGAGMFDRTDPTWYQRVTQPISMGSEDRCVAAQAFGGYYHDAVSRLMITYRETISYGFDTAYGSYGFDTLTTLWTAEVAKRRAT